jgi:transcription elongation GreA/GreB family factor
MNKAFTREDDDRPGDSLPGPVISPHANLVTAEGLALIDTMVARLTVEQATARTADDPATLASATRDLVYWQARRASAELTEPPFSSQVQFGSRVTIARDKSASKTYRVVGTDEADPPNGTLSYVSPLAQALMGKTVGERVVVGGATVELIDIS